MVVRGEDITEENYADVIISLHREEIDSGGVVKHEDAKSFLRWWFR